MSKKHWWPTPAYEARPLVALLLGLVLAAAAFVIALVQGYWADLVVVVFTAGCVLAVYGAVLKQLRREYRAQSAWNRDQH
jgi:heme O synthase-like polyprenyltransferase